MRKYMMVVLPCLLLAHGLVAANETSNRNDRKGEASALLKAAFESERTVEQPSLLPAHAGRQLQFAAKKRRKVEAAPARAEDKSSKPGQRSDRFYMTQNGKQMTADDFDAWMKKNGYRVAAGAPAAPKKAVARIKEK